MFLRQEAELVFLEDSREISDWDRYPVSPLPVVLSSPKLGGRALRRFLVEECDSYI